MFKCLQNKAQTQHHYQPEPPPSPLSASIYQDEVEVPYLAEAMPVDYSSSYNSYNHNPPSHNHSYYSHNNNMLSEPTKDLQLSLEGENKDTFVLVPGILSYDTIELPLPGGKSYIVADYWSDVKEMIDDPLIVSPNPLGVSVSSHKLGCYDRSQSFINLLPNRYYHYHHHLLLLLFFADYSLYLKKYARAHTHYI